ncbi:hypothetical protein O181_041070 [Austropuccinia psidii MF-1]|uniref:Uncharacterized protein n=1 Tax=Austropuccinia psidii MF-1 TaxID=1389203 RepID=A0A9Q3HGT1_9BASI|nr:hypothetical protein [Austropuccinia psidii MF-1]
MANDTPDSQLSIYNQQQWLFQGEEETGDVSNSPTFSFGHLNAMMTFNMGRQSQTGHNAEETPSHALGKRRKRHMHEEAQLHRKQVKHEWTLKRQKQINVQIKRPSN